MILSPILIDHRADIRKKARRPTIAGTHQPDREDSRFIENIYPYLRTPRSRNGERGRSTDNGTEAKNTELK